MDAEQNDAEQNENSRRQSDSNFASDESQADGQDHVSGALGHLNSESARKIGQLILSGQKLAAIKAYREETGAGLKEAKEAVENIMQRAGIESKAVGCSTAALFILAGSGVAGYLIMG